MAWYMEIAHSRADGVSWGAALFGPYNDQDEVAAKVAEWTAQADAESPGHITTARTVNLEKSKYGLIE